MDQYMILREYVGSASAEIGVFYLISILAIVLSIGVISDRNVVRSGFLLIGVFGAISGLFLLLQAQFLALAQIMIYAVGITLVVVIALMLTNPRSEKDTSYEEIEVAKNQDTSAFGQLARMRGALPALVGALSFFTIYSAIRSEPWISTQEPVAADNVRVLGEALTTKYSLPFEFASVLLLAALIGAIMLAKADKKPSITDSAVEE